MLGGQGSGGVVLISSRTQLSELHTPTWGVRGVGISCATFGSLRSFRLSFTLTQRDRGYRNYKDRMVLWKARISSLLWAKGGLWRIYSSIKRRVGRRGGEKSMLTHKSMLSIAENPHRYKTATKSMKTFWASFLFLVKMRDTRFWWRQLPAVNFSLGSLGICWNLTAEANNRPCVWYHSCLIVNCKWAVVSPLEIWTQGSMDTNWVDLGRYLAWMSLHSWLVTEKVRGHLGETGLQFSRPCWRLWMEHLGA